MSNPVVKLLNDRHAGRSIDVEALSDNVVEDLAEAARLTPSCFNNQPWRFFFLLGDEARAKGEQFLNKGNWQWAQRAPLLIIGFTRAEDDCRIDDGRDYHQFDLGMSVMNLMLAATAHDLVARPMAGFKPDVVRELFNLEADQQPLIAIAVGKPSDDVDHLPDYAKTKHLEPRVRKSAEEIITKK